MMGFLRMHGVPLTQGLTGIILTLLFLAMICASIAVAPTVTWSQRVRHDKAVDADEATTFDVHFTFGLDKYSGHWRYATHGSYESLNTETSQDDDGQLENFGRNSDPAGKSVWESADDENVQSVPSVAEANKVFLVMSLLLSINGILYVMVSHVKKLRMWAVEAGLAVGFFSCAFVLIITASLWDRNFRSISALFAKRKGVVDKYYYDDDGIVGETAGVGVQCSIITFFAQMFASLAIWRPRRRSPTLPRSTAIWAGQTATR